MNGWFNLNSRTACQAVANRGIYCKGKINTGSGGNASECAVRCEVSTLRSCLKISDNSVHLFQLHYKQFRIFIFSFF